MIQNGRILSKQYRKALGFSNASATKQFLTGKDIVSINWPLIELYNQRIIDIFTAIQSISDYRQLNVQKTVNDAFTIIRDNNIIPTMTNHGRSPESVYFVWMQGYIASLLFLPYIEKELNTKLIINGADDLSNPSTFARKSDPDFANSERTIFVEFQSGFKGSKVDIKKSKVKTSPTAEYYIAAFDFFNGLYTVINTKEIPDDQWYENVLWEGALCYTVPNDQMKPI